MRTVQIKVYKIDEHPNQEKCFEYIRDNWHDLNQHSVDELLASLKALKEKIGGKLHYSISQVPDRGERITYFGYDVNKLEDLDTESLPLTGVFWDAEVINRLKYGKPLYTVLDILHSETEYVYSDEGLLELCRANEYEFTEDGVFFV